jgi:acyl-CoA synthetase (AMP-forming)/AMP-acid ligase II
MCRYLLAAPVSEYDQKHQVRILLGNGLKANIWQNFVDRFNIQGIVEFYGATEGNTNIGRCFWHYMLFTTAQLVA